jgi:hypothetical protein
MAVPVGETGSKVRFARDSLVRFANEENSSISTYEMLVQKVAGAWAQSMEGD